MGDSLKKILKGYAPLYCEFLLFFNADFETLNINHWRALYLTLIILINFYTEVAWAVMDQGRKVWAPDLNEGFQIGEICDFGTDTISVQPLSGGKIIEAP